MEVLLSVVVEEVDEGDEARSQFLEHNGHRLGVGKQFVVSELRKGVFLKFVKFRGNAGVVLLDAVLHVVNRVVVFH